MGNRWFTVKTRVGFASEEEFGELLEVFAKHEIDMLSVHGRTVKERYQTPVHTWTRCGLRWSACLVRWWRMETSSMWRRDWDTWKRQGLPG